MLQNIAQYQGVGEHEITRYRNPEIPRQRDSETARDAPAELSPLRQQVVDEFARKAVRLVQAAVVVLVQAASA